MSQSEFRDSLNVGVSVTSNGTTASVDGGNVKALELDLRLYGFTGEVRIWVVVGKDEDEYFDLVTASDLLAIELKVAKALYNVSPAPDPLKLSGLVTRRRIREVSSEDVSGAPVLYREYTLTFCDSAKALWSEHRPSTVYAKAKLEKVINENTPSGIALDLSWSALKTTRPIVCLALGEDQASFYDFIFWLADRENGHIFHDYSTQTFTMAEGKPSQGTAVEFAPGALADTGQIQVEMAELPRCAVDVLNSRDGATATLSVDQPHASEGVRRDYLIHTALSEEAKRRQATEKARYTAGRFDVHVACSAYPEMYVAPGVLTVLGGEFSDKLLVSNESLRLLRLQLSAQATNQTPEFDIESDSTEYEIGLSLQLEAAADLRWRGPAYRHPKYPVEVEGKVLSAVGGTGDRAYTLCGDDATDSTYKVSLPNWNSTIAIEVTPDFMPGHMYFPVYKDSRAFISLHFDSARISRFLEWGTDVTVPNASQGNHLLLGRNDKSETSIKHWYVDSQPQLVIARNNSGDQGTLTVKEGLLVLELTEQGGGGGLAATVSVEPEMQMAKAESSQKSELAVADMQDAADTASTEMSGSAQKAATAVREKAEALSTDVEQKSGEVKDALQGISDGIDEQVGQIEQIIRQTADEIEDLLK